MIKLLIFFLLIFNLNYASSRETGQTEITTEDGIEVFQKEKYYLLKKNVEIDSDELQLTGQLVKVFFENGLYDIKELIANDNVNFNSDEYKIKGTGDEVFFDIKNQTIFINGLNSELFLENTEMYSDGKIEVNNISGTFKISGSNSKLKSENIFISGSLIDGAFDIIDGKRDIANLVVEDKQKLNIKTDDISMISKKAIYDKQKSIIELFEEVKISRGNETITGDYGILDTNKNSYKVSSNNSKKVKAIILESDE
tara:strand:+ start:4188 stop:4952 length:765 start_codon:yes stop_codon:yes gene_type:complete